VVFCRLKIIYPVFMANLPPRHPILFDSPASYRIIVHGLIDPSWSDRLEGMVICQATVDYDPQVTSLEGELSDQAALAGIFNTLYELHLTVLAVKRLEIDKEDANQQ
jgi:hypothetical protein